MTYNKAICPPPRHRGACYVRAARRAVSAGLCSLAAAALLAAPARAETNATFEVRATIVNGCIIQGFGSSGAFGQMAVLDFGTVSAFDTGRRTASSTSAAAMVLACTPNLALNIKLGGGNQPSGGSRHLQLGSTANRIAYRLCRDASCNTPVAIDGTMVQAIPASIASAANVEIPFFADLTLAGPLPAGTYTDSVTVTLSW